MEKIDKKSTRLAKNASGYGYKYTELSQINEYCENNDIEYYQVIEKVGDDDYINTILTINGVEKAPRRGSKIVNAVLQGIKNPAQELGSALTYARRYSLLMALGLASEDDDGNALKAKTINNEGNKLKNNGKANFNQNQSSLDVLSEQDETILNTKFNSKLIESGSDLDKVLESYKLSDYSAMTNEQKENAIKVFDLKISKNAKQRKEIF